MWLQEVISLVSAILKSRWAKKEKGNMAALWNVCALVDAILKSHWKSPTYFSPLPRLSTENVDSTPDFFGWRHFEIKIE